MEMRKYGRNWAVYDEQSKLICLTVYKKGAIEVIRRLQGIKTNIKEETANGLRDSN